MLLNVSRTISGFSIKLQKTPQIGQFKIAIFFVFPNPALSLTPNKRRNSGISTILRLSKAFYHFSHSICHSTMVFVIPACMCKTVCVIHIQCPPFGFSFAVVGPLSNFTKRRFYFLLISKAYWNPRQSRGFSFITTKQAEPFRGPACFL